MPDLSLGTDVSGTVDPGNATVAFRFLANEGDRLFFNNLGQNSTLAFRILDGAGDVVYNGSGVRDAYIPAFEYMSDYLVPLARHPFLQVFP